VTYFKGKIPSIEFRVYYKKTYKQMSYLANSSKALKENEPCSEPESLYSFLELPISDTLMWLGTGSNITEDVFF
jgi:hypothetical protein